MALETSYIHKSVLIVILLNIIKTKGQCSYLDMREGYGVPTDICIRKQSYPNQNISILAHCTSSGIEYQEWTDSYQCQGSPSMTRPIDSNIDSSFTEWDYDCGTQYSSDDCDTATIKETCDDSTYGELTVIINECFNINGSSYKVTCDGNGYGTGNIYKYSSPDCHGSSSIQNQRYFGTDSNGVDSYTDCQYYWICGDSNDNNDNSGSNGDDIINEVKDWEWDTKHYALLAGGILLCLLITIICSYCMCCKSKKPKARDNKNDYIAMENVDNEPLVPQQKQHQNNNLSVVYTEYDTIPSAPKMSSVDMVSYNNNNNDDNASLPYGWSKAITEDGKIYYQNNVTKETQWERPMMSDNNDNDDDIELGSSFKRMQTNKGAEGDNTLL